MAKGKTQERSAATKRPTITRVVVTREGSGICVNGYPILVARGPRSIPPAKLREAVIAATESR